MAVKTVEPRFRLNITADKWEAVWREMERWIQYYREIDSKSLKERMKLPFFIQAMAMKVINPEQFKVRDTDWPKMEKEREKAWNKGDRIGDWRSFLIINAAGKIISSSKIEIPPGGGLKVE